MPETDKAIPAFYHRDKIDGPASQTAGYNIFKNVPYVTILIPGNIRDVVDRPVKDADKKRWPEQWAAFERGNEAPEVQGLPIREWPGMTPADVKNLAHHNIDTVEQLAGISDTHLSDIGMGGRALVERARAYLEAAEVGAEATAAVKELKSVKAENERLKEQNAALDGRMRALEAQMAGMAHQNAGIVPVSLTAAQAAPAHIQPSAAEHVGSGIDMTVPEDTEPAGRGAPAEDMTETINALEGAEL